MIFTDNFLSLNPAEIAAAIRGDGVFSLENALRPEFLTAIADDVARNPFGLNTNHVHGVHFGSQYYLAHMLAVSGHFYSYCTHTKVLEICDHLLGDRYRLSAQRYYETYGGHSMRWHTDNKTDRTFQSVAGLIFIAYLSDVDDGEFQYVRGSQRWSGEKAYNEYCDEFIRRNHEKDIASYRKPKGTLLVYDTYGIHRARPVKHPGFARKSLFFQVDRKLEDGEPILLKTEYARVLDDRLKRYLGFGQPAAYRPFPDTQPSHLPISAANLGLIPKWIAQRLTRRAYEMLPEKVQQKLKGALGSQ